MEIKEVDKWINEVQSIIMFLQREIKNLKLENKKNLMSMQKSLNYKMDEMKGLHAMQQPKTQIKVDISGYLLNKIKMSPEFNSAVKGLEEGKNVVFNMEMKLMKKHLPLYLRHEPFGVTTKEIETDGFEDEEIRERVEAKLKKRDKVIDKDGFSYE